MNGLTGEITAPILTLATVADKVLLLPIETTADRHRVLAFVYDDASVGLYPTTDDTLGQFEKLRPIFYVVNCLKSGSKAISGNTLKTFNRDKVYLA